MSEFTITTADGPNPSAKLISLIGEFDESKLEEIKNQLDPFLDDENRYDLDLERDPREIIKRHSSWSAEQYDELIAYINGWTRQQKQRFNMDITFTERNLQAFDFAIWFGAKSFSGGESDIGDEEMIYYLEKYLAAHEAEFVRWVP